MAELESVWKNTLDDLKNKINLPTYKAWFEHITPLSLKKNCLTVSVGSSFAKEWLESRYSKILSDSIKKVTNTKHKIKIITSPDNARDPARNYIDYIDKTAEGADNHNINVKNSTFNEKYTFDTFVVGNGNRFACTASQ